MDQLARERHVQEKLIKPDISALIRRDLLCKECGYNLKGLRYGGKCPECGAGIVQRRIASADATEDFTREECVRLLWGIRALAAGWSGLMFALFLMIADAEQIPVGTALICGGTMFGYGGWVVGKHRHSKSDLDFGEARKRLSMLARLLALAMAIPAGAAGLVAVTCNLTTNAGAMTFFLVLMGLTALSGLAAQVCLCLQLRHLARELDDQNLTDHFGYLLLGLLITDGVGVLSLLLSMTRAGRSALVLGIASVVLQVWWVVSVWRLGSTFAWALRYKSNVADREARLRERMARERLEERQAQAGE